MTGYSPQTLIHFQWTKRLAVIQMYMQFVRCRAVLSTLSLLSYSGVFTDRGPLQIANYCLERCSDSVSKIVSLTTRNSQPPPIETADIFDDSNEAHTGPIADDPTLLLSDLLDPNAFDFSWEALWDTPSGMVNFSDLTN